jgi:plasmid stability protein
MARTLTLRDVPEPVVRALRERAQKNRRSLQKEILAILQGAALDSSLPRRLSEMRLRLGAGMSLKQIHVAIDAGRRSPH